MATAKKEVLAQRVTVEFDGDEMKILSLKTVRVPSTGISSGFRDLGDITETGTYTLPLYQNTGDAISAQMEQLFGAFDA